MTDLEALNKESSDPNGPSGVPLLADQDDLAIITNNDEEEGQANTSGTLTLTTDDTVDTTYSTDESNQKPHFMSSDYLRPWNVFCGCVGSGSESDGRSNCNCNWLCSPALLVPRIQTNFAIFYVNYFRLTVYFVLSALLISPSAILGVGSLAILWWPVIQCNKHDEQKLKRGVVVAVLVSCFVLFYLLQRVFWWIVWTATTVILVHASLRDPTNWEKEPTGSVQSSTFYEWDFMMPLVVSILSSFG
ncbi:expressed unknown protein [Seminavis robusta]|uniref:PRA1 family protein n=1 Tax=Seminavis robusta TaxID=568900 RepID=A0A9N8EPR9_9STRA|nr:expressed unknown protein [Seminavis robusta]|eukprot:Sro1719_g293420.1 n/a (246) ;mRNA; r:10877-11898